jgi:Flp pilus assembly protein TadG
VGGLAAEPLVAVSERGSAPLEAVLSIVFMMLLVMGAIEVSLALYGRNVVAAAAHEGARAALELGRGPESAGAIARSAVRRSSGGLVRNLKVEVVPQTIGSMSYVRVRVAGLLRLAGPIPVPIPVTATATVSKEATPR